MDYKAEFDNFLRGKESLKMDVSVPEMSRLTKEQVRKSNKLRLSKFPSVYVRRCSVNV